jgi:hypothetical protein
MKSNRIRRSIAVLLVLLGILYFVAFALVPKAVAQTIPNLALYYRVRFEVFGQSAQGQHYTDLFDATNLEIGETIFNNPSLLQESIYLLLRWESNMGPFVNGHGDEVVISKEDVTRMQNYLHLLAQHAPPRLSSVIEEELAATPLKDLAGMTMNQAWARLNEDPRFQDRILDSQRYPALKPDSTNAIIGSFSEHSQYEINFDKEIWAVSAWNNGVADSWMAENRNVSDCILTTPRSVSNPYDTLRVSQKSLGNVIYEVQTDIIYSSEILYVVYRPINIAGQLPQSGYSFILYPGNSNPAQCIEQTEAVLAATRFVPPIDSATEPVTNLPEVTVEPLPSTSREEAEVDIYSLLLSTDPFHHLFSDSSTFVIIDKLDRISTPNYSQVLNWVGDSASADFYEIEKLLRNFPSNVFIDKPYEIISRDEVARRAMEDPEWFRECAVISFSSIAFNADFSRASVRMSRDCGSECREVYWYDLIRDQTGWKFIGTRDGI